MIFHDGQMMLMSPLKARKRLGFVFPGERSVLVKNAPQDAQHNSTEEKSRTEDKSYHGITKFFTRWKAQIGRKIRMVQRGKPSKTYSIPIFYNPYFYAEGALMWPQHAYVSPQRCAHYFLDNPATGKICRL